MSKNGVSVFKVAATYIGTVVGAGFGTGQEIFQFFSRFGLPGLAGIAVATFLFVWLGYLIMEQGCKLRASSHYELIRHLCGPKISPLLDLIITFFLFGALSVMFAGTGALFAQQLQLPSIFGSAVMAFFTALTVLAGFSGVISSISFMVPLLLAAVVATCTFGMLQSPPDLLAAAPAKSGLLQSWLLAAVLYVSYNLILSLAVLGPLGAEAGRQETLKKGALWGGLGLGISAALIFLAMAGYLPEIAGMELPMVYIAVQISFFFQLIYTLVLAVEVYTTAVGCLYGFVARVAAKSSPRIKTLVILGTTVAALGASRIGFANLVSFLYPVTGLCGLVFLFCLLSAAMGS